MQAIKFCALFMILFSSTAFSMRKSPEEPTQEERPKQHWFHQLGPHMQEKCAAPDWWTKDARLCTQLKSLFLKAITADKTYTVISSNVVMAALQNTSLDHSVKNQEAETASNFLYKIWAESSKQCGHTPKYFERDFDSQEKRKCARSIAQKWGFNV